MKRGSVQNNEAHFVGVWLPKSMAAALDRAVEISDSDRSKYFRKALREKLERHGITHTHPEPTEAGR